MTALLRFFAALAAAALAFGAPAAAQTLNLRFATLAPDTFPYVDGMKKFKEVVEKRSNGEIRVSLHTAGSLGAEREINEAILEGTIHLGIGAGAMANLAPIYNLVQIPFLIQGQKHMAAVADGPVGAELARRIEAQAGFRVLGWWSTGDSAIETTSRPIRTPEDMKGLKLRVIENPALIDTMRALGANPTPMPLTEVYTGLKQGVVEGAHLDVVLVHSLKAFEVLRYMTDWEQITFLSEPRPVIMKASFFDGLPKKHQEAIRGAVREATAHERAVFAERMKTIRGVLVKAGMQITKVDRDAFLARVRPVWDKYAAQLKAEDLLKRILELQPK
jgi:tripartite ATP-independent transporter DctP family solute receptor